MRVVVVEPDGTTRAVSRDLRVLQREGPAPTRTRAAAAASPTAWQRSGLSQWDCGSLPETVTVTQRPRDLVLYPALVDVDGRVDLTLLPPGAAAMARHRNGVRRLLLKGVPQQTAMVRESVLAERELVLAYPGIGSTAELVDDLLGAAAEAAFALDPPVRDAAAFAERLAAGRAALVPAAEALCALLRDALPLVRRLRRSLVMATDTAAAVRDDISVQLDRLVGPRFLTDTPPEWRRHVPRYLRAAEQRWQRRGHTREREAAAALDAAQGRLEQWRSHWPTDWPWPAALIEYRWLIEELRVSLFAQSLGTARAVSAKRLEQAWQRALESLGTAPSGG
jgi:ATP-dependent helicase HrpA